MEKFEQLTLFEVEEDNPRSAQRDLSTEKAGFEQLSMFDPIEMIEQPLQQPPTLRERGQVEVVERTESVHKIYCLQHPIEMIRRVRIRLHER